MTFGAAYLGTVEVATTQLAMTIWTFLAFAFDAIMTCCPSNHRRVSVPRRTRTPTGHLDDGACQLGLRGAITGPGLACPVALPGHPFHPDPEVRSAPHGRVAGRVAIGQPIAGVVFVPSDGVLIGAGRRVICRRGPAHSSSLRPSSGWQVGAQSLIYKVAFVVAFMGSRMSYFCLPATAPQPDSEAQIVGQLLLT
ncbi:MAG: hypothetical protein R2693_03210 [Nocardioidaceae bacterium]